jgi:peptidoglycan lytic transglycosylase
MRDPIYFFPRSFDTRYASWHSFLGFKIRFRIPGGKLDVYRIITPMPPSIRARAPLELLEACTGSVPLVKRGEMQYDLLEMIHQIANKPELEMGFPFSPLKFVPLAVFGRRPFLLTMYLGLLLSQGCAMLQRPSDTSPPAETTIQPVPAEPKTAKQPIEKTPAGQAMLPQTGEASWYGAQHHGKRTASGEIFDQGLFTAAHRTLPLGSKIKVTNLANGKSVNVTINDRGPFREDRIIDLSQAAAKALEFLQSGNATVRLELLSDP